MIPYMIMAFLFLLAAIFAALEASFSSWHILPWFNGMVWLRIHFITIGVVTQIIFGVTPILTAKYHDLPRPKMRWDIWALLNVGFILLLIGIPLVNKVPIITGGTLIFSATILLFIQLASMRAASGKSGGPKNGRKFYISGLFFLLIGILVGTGFFTGWSGPLGIVGDAGEVHIHANNWGFLSLIFAGLFVDLYETWTKRPLASQRAITPIFWMITLGALALVLSPWLNDKNLAIVGSVLHTSATIWLLVLAIKPLWGDRAAWTPGIAHLLASYFWLFAPLSMAPFVIFGIEGVMPAKALETTTPQALIYGWVLQFGYAIIPYFYQRFFLGDEKAQLGGTWLTFALVNLGSVFLWASILIEPLRSPLHGAAYMLWILSLLPITYDVWQKTKAGMVQAERGVQN